MISNQKLLKDISRLEESRWLSFILSLASFTAIIVVPEIELIRTFEVQIILGILSLLYAYGTYRISTRIAYLKNVINGNEEHGYDFVA